MICAHAVAQSAVVPFMLPRYTARVPGRPI
jgi:hypothetical protein